MRGVNKAIILGNIGRDPETRYTQSGAAVTNVSIATTKAWTDKEGGKQERTEWHRVVFFGKLAEIAGEYLRKGSQVYVEGELRTREWEKDGAKHYTTEIAASEMQFVGARPGPEGDTRQDYGPPAREVADHVRGAASQQHNEPPPDDFDDDIPF